MNLFVRFIPSKILLLDEEKLQLSFEGEKKRRKNICERNDSNPGSKHEAPIFSSSFFFFPFRNTVIHPR